ncbi:asparagine synthase (glutamine-hydrolyzing) [Kwoniella heveanensis CBS 569]|nr:asparagine synthase (glutamine-hydrolyzing) [Kwoniella heveanensis CBS 569]
MCGIVALLTTESGSLSDDRGQLKEQLDASLDRIQHRGPDGRGIWISDDMQCALAHCRLSINDLAPTGDQPLHSPDNHIHAVVNGELYYPESLREELRAGGYTFKGHSDSEVAIALYLKHGESFLSYLRGEFAIVLYDESKKLWIVARDRYGIKPLFWRYGPGRLEVAAEIKAFLGLGWEAEWDVRSIVEAGYGHDTRTLFKGVNKLRPGHYIRCRTGEMPEVRQYWEISFPDKSVPDRRPVSQMIEELRVHLLDAVRMRLRADVPVGIYLSGGIDSTALAGMAAYLAKEEGLAMGSQEVKEKIKCFSIGFDESSGLDESAIARRTAEYLGVAFYKHHMSESTLAENFADTTYHNEHHTQDLNTVGKYVLSTVPREHGYKVVLTGEGADEHFGGYPLYVPDFLREPDEAFAHEDDRRREGVLHFSTDEQRKKVVQEQEEIIKRYYQGTGARTDLFGDSGPTRELNNISTAASLLAFHPVPDIFAPWIRSDPALGTVDPLETIAANVTPQINYLIQKKWHPLHSAHYIWTKGHLVNSFLSCLGDRVEMAHSIEARPPFLDHVVTEYVNHLPPSVKIWWTPEDSSRAPPGGTEGLDTASMPPGAFTEKYILREAVKPFVPEEVYKQRKHPYSAPTRYEPDGPVERELRRWVTKEKVEQMGFLHWREVRGLLDRAFGGKSENASESEGGGTGGGHASATASDVWAWRQVLIIAGWAVLAERFDVATAQPL